MTAVIQPDPEPTTIDQLGGPLTIARIREIEVPPALRRWLALSIAMVVLLGVASAWFTWSRRPTGQPERGEVADGGMPDIIAAAENEGMIAESVTAGGVATDGSSMHSRGHSDEDA